MCTKDTIRCIKIHDETPIPLCCKEHLFELLDFITHTLDANKIPYWLDYGTLLGATRDNKHIPWDDDCDISIFIKDEDKVGELLAANEYGYILYNNPTVHNVKSFMAIGYSEINRLHVDIFAWKKDGNLMKRHNYLDNGPISPDAKKGKHFPYEFVKTLSKIKLDGKEYLAPNNPVEFCKMRYGKAWNTPMTVAAWNTTIDNNTNKIYSFD